MMFMLIMIGDPIIPARGGVKWMMIMMMIVSISSSTWCCRNGCRPAQQPMVEWADFINGNY
jgi:hypothetical protein